LRGFLKRRASSAFHKIVPQELRDRGRSIKDRSRPGWSEGIQAFALVRKGLEARSEAAPAVANLGFKLRHFGLLFGRKYLIDRSFHLRAR